MLLAVLTPAGALVGAFLASMLQVRYQRRAEAVDHLTALLHEIVGDFHRWIAPYRIAGEPDKFTRGRLMSDKLNLLNGYRSRYSLRLDSTTKAALDAVIGQLSRRFGEYHDALPAYHGGGFGDPYKVSEDPGLERTRVATDEWLREGLPEAMRRLEDEFSRSLKLLPNWWGRRFGG